MNPVAHPFISIGHLFVFLGYTYLAYRLPWTMLGSFCLLTVAQYLAWLAAFVSSPDAQPLWYWCLFWTLEFSTAGLVTVFAIRYGVRYCRHFRIGRGNAGIVMGAVFCLALALMLLKDGEPANVLLLANYAVRILVGGVVALMLAVCEPKAIRHHSRWITTVQHQQRTIMDGFAALYLIGLVTSSLMAYKPLTREVCWVTDLGVQLAVVSFWIWKLRAVSA